MAVDLEEMHVEVKNGPMPKSIIDEQWMPKDQDFQIEFIMYCVDRMMQDFERVHADFLSGGRSDDQ